MFDATLDPASDDWEAEMQRRAFLRNTAVAGLAMLSPALAGEPWDRLTAALQRPSTVDAKTLDDLEAVTANFERLYQQLAPAVIAAPVAGHFRTLTRLLEGQQPERLRRRVASLAGETAALAGWLASDAGDHTSAQGYYRSGIEAAREAGDNALGAYLLGSASVLPMFRETPHQVVYLFQGGAHGFSSRDATPTTRAWLSALEAEAHTANDNSAQALHSLDAGETYLANVSLDRDARPLLTFFDEARLAGERGVTAVHAGELAEAEQALQQALNTLDPSTIKIRSRLLTALATAHARQGNIEEACTLAIESLNIAAQTETAPSLSAVGALRAELRPWNNTESVRQLDDHLAARLTV